MNSRAVAASSDMLRTSFYCAVIGVALAMGCTTSNKPAVETVEGKIFSPSEAQIDLTKAKIYYALSKYSTPHAMIFCNLPIMISITHFAPRHH